MTDKAKLRSQLRKARVNFEAALPDATRALLFLRPPAPVAELVPAGAVVSVYHPTAGEAPALGYARWFAERGHPIALPWFAARGAEMAFRQWHNPHDDDELVADPYGALQPAADAPELIPQVAICPLVGFSASGARLGQGGGYYDRFLARTPGVVAIGIAWDCQRVDDLPVDPHDMPLAAVVTQTRFYGPF